MAKLRVAVLFGGVSSEHEISCISAASIVENLSPSQYEVIKIGITKSGRWLHYPGGTELMRSAAWHEFPDCTPAFISPDRTTKGLVSNHGGQFDAMKIDVVFPVLHGRNGEDGTVQGLLDLAGIPYVGCNLLSSAMCMDKHVANTMFVNAGLLHTPWVTVCRHELDNIDAICEKVEAALQYPVFVKPAVGGSSVGISKAKSTVELQDALKLASAHDRKIVIEQGITGQEVECAVLGNNKPIASLPGEIVSCNEMYDYEAKYLSGQSSKLLLPADLPEDIMLQVQQQALQAYTALGCTGLSRVDFFVEQGTHRILINEINTLPGFTSISMYPKLMEHSGIPYPVLCDKLIELALENAEG